MSAHARRTTGDIGLAAAIGLGVMTIAALMVVGRGVTFFLDDWYFIAARRGVSLASLLTPHNGHLLLLLVLAYKVLLVTAGMDQVWVFRLALATLQATIVVLLFVVLRRRTSPEVAFVLVVPIALLGAAWSDLLSPFQIGFLGSVACGLAAVLTLELPGRRGAVATAVLTVLALAWSGVGLVFLPVVAIEAVARRGLRECAVILAGPIVLYGAWYVGYRQSQVSNGVGAALTSVWDGLPHVLGSLIGADESAGRLLALTGAYAIVVVSMLRRRLPAGTVAGLAGVIVFFTLTGYTRGATSFAESRYQLPACVLLVLAAGSLLPSRRPPGWLLAGGAAAAVLAVASGWSGLTAGRAFLINGDRPILAQLRAAEVGRKYADPGFQPSPQGLGGFTQASYISMVDAFGSPATPLSRLRREDAATRAGFDATLLGAEQLGVTTIGRIGAACRPSASPDLPLAVRAGTVVEIRAKPRSAAGIALRRLAPAGTMQPAGMIAPDQSARVVTKRDAVPEPWILVVSGAARVVTCS